MSNSFLILSTSNSTPPFNPSFVLSKLVDRVRNIQKNAVGGDGTNQCGMLNLNFPATPIKMNLLFIYVNGVVLCGDYASVFLSWSLTSARHVTCKDCLKVYYQIVIKSRVFIIQSHPKTFASPTWLFALSTLLVTQATSRHPTNWFTLSSVLNTHKKS